VHRKRRFLPVTFGAEHCCDGLWQLRRIIAKHQAMPVVTMFEVIVNVRLLAQALEQLLIRLVILGAESSDSMLMMALEAPLCANDPMLPEHLIKDLRHRPAIENALTEAQAQAAQLRSQTHSAQSRSTAVFVLDKALQLPVHTLPQRAETEKRRSVQQAGKVQLRVVDQHIDLERKRLTERFVTGKGQNFERVGQTRYIETKQRLVEWIEHWRISTGGAAGDSRREAWPSRVPKYNLGNDLREKQTG